MYRLYCTVLYSPCRDLELDRLQPGQVVKVPVVLGLEHFREQQQQQQHKQHADDGWFGLGRLLHQQHNSSSSGGTASTAQGGAVGQGMQQDGADGAGSSSSGSSSEDWLEPGSSVLAAGTGSSSSWQQHLSSKRGHLLQLVAAHRASDHWNSRLGASESEFEPSTSSTPSSSNSRSSSSSRTGWLPDVHSPAAAAVAHAAAAGHVPDEGVVAVKIQYPGALQTMTLDLVNLRSVSAFLQKTELQFDLVSAVDELQKQIHLEFDFMR